MRLDIDILEPSVSFETEEGTLTCFVPNRRAADYLNRYLELAARLELLPQKPETAAEALAWKSEDLPTLLQEFLRDPSYAALSAPLRARFDTTCAELDMIALATIASLRCQFRHGAPKTFDQVTPICHRAVHKIRIVVSRALRLVIDPRKSDA